MAVGPLTIRPLLATGTPSALLALIRSLAASTTSLSSGTFNRILPSLLKALRNVLFTTADLVWGHMWGVGAEKKVVDTGLVGNDTPRESSAKGKGVLGKDRNWRIDASRALGLAFEVRPSTYTTTTIHLTHVAREFELFDGSDTAEPRYSGHFTLISTLIPFGRFTISS